MVKIIVENITKKIGKKTVLDNVSFEVESGTITSIVGPAGAGKTTLLKIIAGVEYPDSGRIIINGEDVTNYPPKDRDVAMVFQTYALYPHMKVFDNIAFPLRVKKLPENEIRQRVREIAELLGITHILDRSIYEISGGEAQRTALARALVRKSRIVILDEPLTNLDYKIREKMRGELKKIAKEIGGVTWIYATPDAREALAISTHSVFLYYGKVLQYGHIDSIYSSPRNLTIASYFSYPRLNTFECDFVNIADKYYVRELTGLFRIDVTSVAEAFKANRYIVGVRPIDLRLEKTSKSVISIPAHIRLIESMGSDTVLHLESRLTPSSKETELDLLYPGVLTGYEIGQRIMVHFDPKDVLIFEKDTEKFITNGKRIVSESRQGGE
ncbi:MAG: ABC transporter ATP-binding protein [Crenarchaeota archaeon]|nr:ABC transporter ATP-binding protein [Thermoproteota archaeon]